MRRRLLLAIVFMSLGISSCRRPTTETRAPGQPTMNELMHRSADQRRAEEAKSHAQYERARNMTSGEAAKLESELRANPGDVEKREQLFAHYLARKDWPKLNRHLLWAIDHEKNEPGARIVWFIPDPAVDRKGYELGKRHWMARLEAGGKDVTSLAVRYIASDDKQIAEKMILERQAKDSNEKIWNHLLAGVYYEALLGSRGPLQGGVIRSVSLSDAHGSYAQSVRRKLDETSNAELLLFTGRRLMEAERLYREGHVDFDPFALGKQYIERGIALQPDSRLAQLHRVLLDRFKAHRNFGDILRRGGRPEDLLKNATEDDRLDLLPMLINREMYGGNGAAADDRSREYLTLVKRHPDHPRYRQSLFEANMNVGKLALHRGDRRTAVQHLLAAVDPPGSAELRFMQMDMSLARSLVDWGERESVAKFLDRCAQINQESEKYKLWAADIRKGINPDLIPYTTGCGKDPC